MRFSDMPYVRPDIQAIKSEILKISEQFSTASDYESARAYFIMMDELSGHIDTQANLAHIRHTIDTRNAFYDQEIKFWNQAEPELEEYMQNFQKLLFGSPFRKSFEEEYGDTVFRNIELQLRSFRPELIPLMQEESDLVTEYRKLIASAQIPFEDGVYTLSQLTPFKNDPDDERRLKAWKAEGEWYKEKQPELDRIYDSLVKLRDKMGRILGYDGFTELGYDRMQRNCYRKDDVKKFREAVRKYIVPLADKIRREQAERLGKPYPLSFSDMAMEFHSGNPKPAGNEEYILKMGQFFYDSLSEETGEFFRTMLDMQLMDVLSTEGKASGGYCTSLADYHVPFIFANFNGTQGDVDVVTHEAGHAFAAWMNRYRVPKSSVWPSLEACEVHSMSMEFFAWPWADKFFGDDTDKYLYSHLSSAITFIPYGTMVDHFQHTVYEKPGMSPSERHAEWKKLLGIYMPWVKLDGEIPFYSDGEGWQRQSHIYFSPFYYIDYCLAQTVSLQFWAMIQEDVKKAWDVYMAYTRQGGSEVFTRLLENAGLDSPFDPACLKKAAEKAAKWLDSFDKHKLI